MKKILLFSLIALSLIGCNNPQKSLETTTNNAIDSIDYSNVKDKSFEQLFKKIEPTDLTDNVFKLVGQDYSVITAGSDSLYNSMTASYGGWGQLFDNPTTWCFLRANRYTLELIKEGQTYTMSYFPDQYKKEVLYFGSKTGRDTDKMKDNKLTFVKTPDGNITYKEAKLVIECKLVEVTTVNPDDFYTEKGKTFVQDAKKDANDYHKLVFGEITNVWIRK